MRMYTGATTVDACVETSTYSDKISLKYATRRHVSYREKINTGLTKIRLTVTEVG